MIFNRLHQKLKAWKPIHLCWLFEKYGWKIPSYFIGQSSSSSSSCSSSFSSSSSCSSSFSSSSSSESARPEKQVIIKLYDKDNVYQRVLSEALNDFTIERTLYSGSGPLTLILKTKVDDLASDIAINSKIRIYSRNKWNYTPQLVYYGYITSIDPVIVAGGEQAGITCLGAVSKLQNDFLRTGTDLAYEVAPDDIDNHINTIITHYRSSLNTLYGNYNASMLDDTANYWADTDYIEDTSGIGTIPYRFFNAKHLNAVKEIAKFLPKNDDGDAFWYWYIGDFDDGTYNKSRFVLKKLNTSYDHRLFINKHLISIDARKNIEGLKNKVFFWNEKGDFAGEMVRTVYEDSDSQNLYDIVADRIGDSQVSTFLQARLLAEGKMKESKDARTEAVAIVSDANYDILSFNLGDIVEVRDLKNTTLFRKLILADTASANGTTTTLIDSSRTEADDYWNDYYIKFIGEDNDGETREITDFVDGTNTISFRALDNATASGDKYEIYAKNCRLVITKMLLTLREVTLELSTPRPDLTTQVESDRDFVDKQLKWFGNILTRIDGTRISTGVQHWLTDDFRFVPGDNPDGGGSNTDTKISWRGDGTNNVGTFYLPNDVRRVVSEGTSSAMATPPPTIKYYFFIDEATCYYDDAAIVSGDGITKEGETFMADASTPAKDWTTDEWKGYILVIDPGGGDEEKHIITRNTDTILYLEAHDPIDTTFESGSEVSYEIHAFALRETNDRNTGSLLKTGSATDADGTTTTLDDSTLTQANDFWNGYEIKFLSGDNIGLSRTITDFDATNDRLTFSPALTNAVTNGDTYQLYISSDTRIIIMAGEGNSNADQTVKMDHKLPTVQPPCLIEGSLRGYDAINGSRNLITDLINDRMDTAAKTILEGFTFDGAAGHSFAGALKTGDITWNDTDGSITGGTGIVINKWGIIGAYTNGGVPTTTFSIDATTGDATFSGAVTAATITGGTITGATIQTAAVNNRRVALKAELYVGGGDASLIFYNSSNAIIGGISAVNDDSQERMTLDVGTAGIIEFGLGLNASANTVEFRSHGAGGVYGTVVSISGLGNVNIAGNITVGGTVDGVDIQNHKSRHYALGADTIIRTTQSSGSNLGISAGWAYTHDTNASAHHSSTSNGLAITPASVNTSAGLITCGGLRANASTNDIGSTTTNFDNIYLADIYWTNVWIMSFGRNAANIDIINKNIVPYNDNDKTCGSTGQRWSDLRTVLINGSDYCFENEWVLTENDRIGIVEKGIAILDESSTLRLFIGKTGLYVPKGNIKNLDELPYVKTTLEQRGRMDAHPEKRQRLTDKEGLEMPDIKQAKIGGAKYIPKKVLLKKNIVQEKAESGDFKTDVILKTKNNNIKPKVKSTNK